MTAARDRIWVTRAQPGAAATAERLGALGWRALVAPLLEVRALGGPIDLAGVAALAFTSANGVRAFAAASRERRLPAHCVGDATAAAARAAGFVEVRSADGDTDALARLLIADPPRGRVLHAAAAVPTGDLVGQLSRAGIEAHATAVYETVAAPSPKAALAALDELAGVLLHSPRAAGRLEVVLTGRSAPELAVYCLSGQVAQATARLALGPRFTAPMPTEQALLSLLPGRREPTRKAK